MFALIKANKKEDYFLSINDRPQKGVYFCRFIGYEKDTLLFLHELQKKAEKSGVYVRDGLKNPEEKRVSGFTQAVDLSRFALDKTYMQAAADTWFPEAPPMKRKRFAEALYATADDLNHEGSNLNILKNMFVKWMCWGKEPFLASIRRAGDIQIPLILYEGDISKHEVYMLRILSRAGCDIAYVNYHSDDSYRKADPASAWSALIEGSQKGEPAVHFSKMGEPPAASASPTPPPETISPRSAPQRHPTAQTAASGPPPPQTPPVLPQAANRRPRPSPIVTNTWIRGSVMEEIVKTNAARSAVADCCNNLYVRYLGIDNEDQYLLRLYKLKETLLHGSKPLVLADTRLTNPTLEEVKAARPISYQNSTEVAAKLAAAIDIPGDNHLTGLLREAFMAFILERDEPLSRLYNTGMKLLCWLLRYQKRLFAKWKADNLPVFLYYGNPTDSEAEFMNLLSAMPVDVLVISPDKKAKTAFESSPSRDRGMDEMLPETAELFPFPQKEPKVRAVTAAYAAQRELDTLLYSDTGLFRDRQFTRCNPVTLKTTYEEIDILWREEAKYRPGFEAAIGRVAVPNIFARVCGVKDGDQAAYLRSMEKLMTERTIYIRAFPFIGESDPNPMRGSAHKFIENRAILPDKIKRSKDYPYDYLSEDTQDYILEKIQQLIDLNWIEADTQGVEYAVLATLLNLDKRTLRLIQQFDFTREIPKVIVAHTNENMPTLQDCIYLAFLNLAGFDIAVFTPTGYRDLDKHIRRDAYEEYQIGTYVFNMNPPDLRRPPSRNGGLLGKIFGKG